MEEYLEICKAWDTLGKFVASKTANLTPEEINDRLDSIGTDFNMDEIDSWPAILQRIIKIGE